MLVIEALLAQAALPGEIDIDCLTMAFIKIAKRNPQYEKDVSVPLDDEAKVKQLLSHKPDPSMD